MSTPFIEDNDQTRARREHLEQLRALVGNVYPNKFERSRATGSEDTISAVASEETIRKMVGNESFDELFNSIRRKAVEGEKPAPEELEAVNAELNKIEVRIAGRISTPPRVMGKAAFVHLSDGLERLQIYVRKADVTGLSNDRQGDTVDGWQLFNLLDHGDFIGVAGYLFVTKTGELSVHVRELQFLAKALLPMPGKVHGISNPEIRQRQRYADLIAGSLKLDREEGELTPREVFQRRSRLITEMRRFLDDHGYIEVETPMLTPLATGAAAKPFKTHHNALGIDLYARIAPELYLKRLLVGGFEKVYELNRNFRNEGIGYRWNPEFTMLEFYCAYMDVNGMMDFCEELLRVTAKNATGFEFGKFKRLSMKDAIRTSHWFNEVSQLSESLSDENALNNSRLVRKLSMFSDELKKSPVDTETGKLTREIVSTLEIWERVVKEEAELEEPDDLETAQNIENIFSSRAEVELIEPTFIVDFPKPISPLSKASPQNALIAERFELFINMMEIANGFSELNDPVEQRERFLEQTQQRERGDEEAMVLDEDYIRALSYGMPPAAGIGIGIDRLTMILTGKRTIREVILFPHMRPERKAEETQE
ncbi:MAG: lysine--tRNA ligase [Pyrinomonadaceae bacterium]